MADGDVHVMQWEVQRYERHSKVWLSGPYGRTDTDVGPMALGMAALAAYLVSSDRALELIDRRVCVRRDASASGITAVTEDDLQAHLHQAGYYDTIPRPPLRDVLDATAVEALPAYLRKELDQALGG